MSSFNKDWFLYKGLKVRYGVRPGKPGTVPLLMFNGLGQSIEAWDPLIDAMPEVEIIAYDVPGAGMSTVPDHSLSFQQHARLAKGLLEHLGYEHVNAFGLSWGGGLAQQFSYQYPRTCKKLVLAAAIPGCVMFPGSFSAYTKMSGMRRFSDKEYMASIAGEIYGGDLRHNGKIIEQLSSLQELPPTRIGYERQARAMSGWSSLPFLWRLAQPTLILHGEDDPLVPAINARVMARIIPKSRLELIDCGHLFTLTRIPRISPIIQEFVHG